MSVLPPEVESDVLTSRPGASVTLTCPGAEPGDNATVHWVLRNQATGSNHGRRAGLGRRLLLRSVQLNDSGNYSCYQDGHPAGTVRLLVDGELCPRCPCRRLPAQQPCALQSPLPDPSHSRYFLGPWILGKGPLTSAHETPEVPVGGATGCWGHHPAGLAVQFGLEVHWLTVGLGSNPPPSRLNFSAPQSPRW